MITTPDWMSESLCRKKHGDIWFPPFETTTPEINYAIAKKVCNVCPVWTDCLSFGKKEIYGVWGGLTPQERLPMQKDSKQQFLAEHGTVTRYRQGCVCETCSTAHDGMEDTEYVLIDEIPNLGEKLPDLKKLLQRLLEG
jgi:WhiB family redox-sensing transcriptional regulator